MRLAKKVISFISALWIASCSQAGFTAVNLPAQLSGGYTTETVSFGEDDWQKADIYRPEVLEAEAENVPVIVFLHGGRWSFGTKEDYRFMGINLAKKGYIAVLPDYRKYPDVRFPDFAKDGAAAIAYAYKNIRGENAPLFVSGHSSGAHTGSIVVADSQYLDAYGLNPDTAIAGYIGLAGPYDFIPEEEDLKDMFGPPERYPQMQVPNFIDGNEPPMLLMYGEKDNVVYPRNHRRLAAKIKETGGDVTVKTYPNADHAGLMKAFTWVDADSQIRDDFFRFVEKISQQK